MSAFEKRLAGGVQIEGDGVLVEKGVEPDVWVLCIDAGSLAARGDKLVADGVLDAEGKKVEAR